MKDWKMILGVVLGAVILVGVMVWGLSKMSGEQGGLNVEVDQLVDGAGWVTGGENYQVTVVEFADLQCSACKQAEPVAEELRQMDGVRYVYRHLPLSTIHKNTWRAARVAEAAKVMEKGWEMVELLFEKQEEWAETGSFDKKAMDYAIELGLEGGKFEELYNSKEVEDQIVKDNTLANELRLGGTPTFFVEGEQVASSFVLTRVREILESN